MVSIRAYAILSTLLFGIGIYGALARRHAVGVLIAIELMINAATLNFVSFARLHPADRAVTVQWFAVFSITLAAAEAIVGLALVLALYRAVKSASLDKYSLMKW